MKLRALRITNFRSFRKQQTFTFPTEPGLYFMQGVNEVEPRLEGNATGKTTIWAALCWLWFGKMPNGLKAGDVCTWGVDKGTVVELDFEAPSGEDCTVRRTWGPNSWTLGWKYDPHVEDLTKSESNPVLGWLGLSFMPFLHSVLLAQRAPMFLDLGREAQASLFSDGPGSLA
jgi:DNA repair exonuclease SbcCD ATPase subunit